jgi:hypothetical protein
VCRAIKAFTPLPERDGVQLGHLEIELHTQVDRQTRGQRLDKLFVMDPQLSQLDGRKEDRRAKVVSRYGITALITPPSVRLEDDGISFLLLNLLEQNMPCRCQGVFCDRSKIAKGYVVIPCVINGIK